jgi:hypothetical protein
MEGKRNARTPEYIKKGGRGLKVPFPNEHASNREDSVRLSDGEDEPHTYNDRVFLCAADMYVKEEANTEQGYKDDKPADLWEAGDWKIFLECRKDCGDNCG